MTLRDHLGPRTDATAALHDELDALLPCPFCGGEADIRRDHTVEENHAFGCRKCDVWFDTFNSDDAITAWNTRALGTAALKRVIERALEMAGRVKALEWKNCDATAASEVYAETAFGLYMIDRYAGGGFLLTHCDIGVGKYETVEAAKAAAQGDYQTRGDAMRPAITADDVLRELGGRGNG